MLEAQSVGVVLIDVVLLGVVLGNDHISITHGLMNEGMHAVHGSFDLKSSVNLLVSLMTLFMMPWVMLM